MKKFYAILLGIIFSIPAISQVGAIYGTIEYNNSTNEIIATYYVANQSNSNANFELVGITVGLQFDESVVTQTSSKMLTYDGNIDTSKLNAYDYNSAFGPDVDQDMGTRVANVLTGGTKTYRMMHYTRSTKSCKNIWDVPANSMRALYRATFTLNAPYTKSYFRLDSAAYGFGSNRFIAEFINSETADVSNSYKNILFVVDQNKKSNLQPYDQSSVACVPAVTQDVVPISEDDISFQNPFVLLPFSLNYFRGVKSGVYNELYWQTVTETDSYGFELQKQNAHGDFESIAFIPAQSNGGTSQTMLNYSYTDRSVQTSKITYYRLKQISTGINYEYSSIVAIKNEIQKTLTVQVFPNPVRDVATIEMTNVDGPVQVLLIDYTGRIVQQWRKNNFENIQISNLNKGAYYVKVINEQSGETAIQKILVSK